jgi:hypothetical protein
MKTIKSFLPITGCLLIALCCPAAGSTLFETTTSLTTSDPIQRGRLSRNGIPQDWANTETFPGIINTGVTYHYRTFVLPSAALVPGRFVQISLDHLGPVQGTLFVSVYINSYKPNSGGANRGFDKNWIGDLGFSGNTFGVDPQFLEVVVPAGADLVVVVNNTDGNNVGVGQRFRLLVETFTDVLFTNPAQQVQ